MCEGDWWAVWFGLVWSGLVWPGPGPGPGLVLSCLVSPGLVRFGLVLHDLLTLHLVNTTTSTPIPLRVII